LRLPDWEVIAFEFPRSGSNKLLPHLGDDQEAIASRLDLCEGGNFALQALQGNVFSFDALQQFGCLLERHARDEPVAAEFPIFIIAGLQCLSKCFSRPATTFKPGSSAISPPARRLSTRYEATTHVNNVWLYQRFD
jgi:hypothetical protein